jgi:hypothetical protein
MDEDYFHRRLKDAEGKSYEIHPFPHSISGNKENKNRTYLHKIGSYLLLKTSMCEIKITIGGWGKLN